MKNYYAILEVPVGCSLEEIRQAYRRLVQENLDDETVFADLKGAYEVLTTPARRAEYDQATWGETFVSGGSAAAEEMSHASVDAAILASAHGGRCPLGAEAQCPVLQARVVPGEKYCSECGYLLAALSGGTFDSFGQPSSDQGIRLQEPGGQAHRLRPGLNLVGRESADVLLPDKTVSRQHARLEVGEDGTVTVEDLSSTNGTQVGGEMLVPHVPRSLRAADRVRFGSVLTELHLPMPAAKLESGLSGEEPQAAPQEWLTFSENSAETPAAQATFFPPGEARAQVVEMREGDGRAYPLVPGVTTFGRRAENSVVIQGDPYVSGNHAQIIAEGDIFRLTDIGSTNGTLLNGERLAINEAVTLTPGDVVLVGGTALRFEPLEMAMDVAAEGAAFEDTEAEETETASEVETASEFDPETTSSSEETPAEPRARNAQEYDVPAANTPPAAFLPHDTSTHAEG